MIRGSAGQSEGVATIKSVFSARCSGSTDRAARDAAPQAPGRVVGHEADLDDIEAMPLQQLAQRRLVVPAHVSLVDARPAADPVHEVRHREHVRGREHERSAGREITARRVEERARARKVLDHLAAEHDIERTAEIHRLRVGDDDLEASFAGTCRELAVDLDADGLGRDRRDQHVHPIRPIDPRTGADVEHTPPREVLLHAREPVEVRSRLPVGLQRMTRAHGRERTALVAALTVALTLLAGACSSSEPAPDAAPATTTTAIAPVTTTTAAAVPGVVPVDGTGDHVVVIPPSVGLPAIVHAEYEGAGSFVVKGVDGSGRDTTVLAASLGGYNGTFPVGFVDAKVPNPNVGLHVITTGPWHLDMAPARLAPPLGRGRSGTGDAVLSYVGPAATMQLVHDQRTRFVVGIYGQENLTLLADQVGPYRGRAALPAGPVFIVVSTTGEWSISLV